MVLDGRWCKPRKSREREEADGLTCKHGCFGHYGEIVSKRSYKTIRGAIRTLLDALRIITVSGFIIEGVI